MSLKTALYALALAASSSFITYKIVTANNIYDRDTKVPKRKENVAELIGDTPMVRINSLSDATGCEIYAKLELANPGGSAKDRVALAVIKHLSLIHI